VLGSGSIGVGVWSVSSPARARPSAAVATRPPPSRLATKHARSAASRTSSAVAPSIGNEEVPADASSERGYRLVGDVAFDEVAAKAAAIMIYVGTYPTI